MSRPATPAIITSAAAAAGAALCFFLLADAAGRLPLVVAAWAGSCALDMGYTVRHGGIIRAHERNPVLRAALRLPGGLRAAVPAALAAEAALVAVGPFAILHAWDSQVFAALCGAAAGAHVCGYLENRRFVRRLFPRGPAAGGG